MPNPAESWLEKKGTGDKHFVIGAWTDWDNSNVNRKSLFKNYVNEMDGRLISLVHSVGKDAV